MPIKTNKVTTDAALRAEVFSRLNLEGFTRINDRSFGILLTDVNGAERYVRVNAVVAEEREDMTAAELMKKETNDYEAKQAKKAEKAAEKQAKAAANAAARAAKKEKEGA